MIGATGFCRPRPCSGCDLQRLIGFSALLRSLPGQMAFLGKLLGFFLFLAAQNPTRGELIPVRGLGMLKSSEALRSTTSSSWDKLSAVVGARRPEILDRGDIPSSDGRGRLSDKDGGGNDPEAVEAGGEESVLEDEDIFSEVDRDVV